MRALLGVPGVMRWMAADHVGPCRVRQSRGRSGQPPGGWPAEVARVSPVFHDLEPRLAQ
jgi:hypothetical protein